MVTFIQLHASLLKRHLFINFFKKLIGNNKNKKNKNKNKKNKNKKNKNKKNKKKKKKKTAFTDHLNKKLKKKKLFQEFQALLWTGMLKHVTVKIEVSEWVRARDVDLIKLSIFNASLTTPFITHVWQH